VPRFYFEYCVITFLDFKSKAAFHWEVLIFGSGKIRISVFMLSSHKMHFFSLKITFSTKDYFLASEQQPSLLCDCCNVGIFYAVILLPGLHPTAAGRFRLRPSSPHGSQPPLHRQTVGCWWWCLSRVESQGPLRGISLNSGHSPTHRKNGVCFFNVESVSHLE